MRKYILILSIVLFSCETTTKNLPTGAEIREVNNYVVNTELRYLNSDKPYAVVDSNFFAGVDLIIKQSVFYMDTFLTDSDKRYMTDQLNYYLKRYNQNMPFPSKNDSAKTITSVYMSRPLFSVDKNTCLVFLSFDLKKNKLLVLSKINDTWENIAMKDLDFSEQWLFRRE